MGLTEDNKLADRIVAMMPTDERTLALMLGTTLEHIASICMTLHRQHRIQLDRSWDAPRHWKAVK